MGSTKTEKQAKAQRLKDLYESMSDERLEDLDKEIRDITSECNDRLQGAADAARSIAGGRFYELVVRRYTEDEIEAVLKHHNSGRFELDVYEGLRDVWIRDWLPEHEQKSLESIQKGESK
jgi:hypothetical protein